MEYQRPLTPEESRRMSLVTGVMWLVTFATSIPALWLFQPLLDDPAGYVMGAGDDDNRILLGAFLELLLIISNIATAVIPYPLLKRQHEGCALGFVAARIVESTFILVGILSVLTVVGLRTSPPSGVGKDTLGSIAYSFAALKDWTFLLGRVRRWRRERTALRLLDVPIRPRPATDGASGAGRRAALDRLGRRCDVRRGRAGWNVAGALHHP